MLDHADKDRDKKINFEEFEAVVTREYPQIWENRKKLSEIFIIDFILF